MSLQKDDATIIDVEKVNFNEENVIHPFIWKFLLFIGVFIYSSFTILVHLCEVDGKIPFKSASMVLLIELTKFILSTIMYSPEIKNQGGLNIPPFNQIISFLIPAILYCSTNNLSVYIQLEMDPATYQVLCNFKILTTAILFRLIIQREITKLQWGALSILLSAGIMNSYGGLVNKNVTHNAGLIHITITGLIMISIYCTLSGLSGVYTEYVFKKQKQLSIHLQNGLLYLFGMMINGLLFIIQSVKSDDYSIFTGYTHYTWLLVITQAIGGLIMGAVLKHASNITRIFLISTAMVLTTILSMIIFGLQLNLYFIISMGMVCSALYLYHC